MINITLDKETTFDLPQGQYHAELTQIKAYTKQVGRYKQDWIRLVWKVSVDGKEDLDCRAGRNFLLSFKSGSDLRDFLTPILAPNFFKDNSAKNIDVEKVLTGLKGVVTLSHYTGQGFEKPMVVVESFEGEGKD